MKSKYFLPKKCTIYYSINAEYNAAQYYYESTTRKRDLTLYEPSTNATLPFYTPVKDGSYYVVPSVRSYVRPSINFSCPLHNSDSVKDVFMKLGTNINHHQTMCREQEMTLHLLFLRNYCLLKFFS